MSLTTEEWGDVATLGTMTLMWAVMLWFEVRRTWRWDALGSALTVLTACLMISYGAGTLAVFADDDFWRPEIRWAIRVALIFSGVVTIIVLAFDRSPATETWNPGKPERRSGLKDRRSYDH